MRNMFGVCLCVWWVETNLLWIYVWTLNDVILYYSICNATFENECMICNHGVMLFCFFSNNVQAMFGEASSFNIDISSWNTSEVIYIDVSLGGMRNMFGVCFCVWWVETNFMLSYVCTLNDIRSYFSICVAIYLKINVWL